MFLKCSEILDKLLFVVFAEKSSYGYWGEKRKNYRNKNGNSVFVFLATYV